MRLPVAHRRALRVLLAAVVAAFAVAIAPTVRPGRRADAQGTPPFCTTDQIGAAAFWQGATGSLAGGIVVQNQVNMACAVSGYPAIVLTDAEQQPLAVEPATMPPPDAAPAEVVLQPGDEALVPLQWFNYCGPKLDGVLLLLTLPGSSTVAVGDFSAEPLPGNTPRCDAPDFPSTLSIYPFQPRPQ